LHRIDARRLALVGLEAEPAGEVALAETLERRLDDLDGADRPLAQRRREVERERLEQKREADAAGAGAAEEGEPPAREEVGISEATATARSDREDGLGELCLLREDVVEVDRNVADEDIVICGRRESARRSRSRGARADAPRSR